MTTVAEVYKWQFKPRFRRHAFGWKSQPAITRIKEAVSEIKKVEKKDTVLAGEGAVCLLERISPAIEQVDGSSGSIGSAVNYAIETLVPIIASAPAEEKLRRKWLARLMDAIEADEIPYLETLSHHWGELCSSAEIASEYADEYIDALRRLWSDASNRGSYLKTTTICLSSLLAAKRYDELRDLLALDKLRFWPYQQFIVRALVAQGKRAEAIRHAESCRSQYYEHTSISRLCEEILIDAGFADEAYSRYALETSIGMSNIATYRAIAKKYPHKKPENILRDLIESTPGSEGKWFATAKELSFLELAVNVAKMSPCDPRTLTRASRDYIEKDTGFSMCIGLIALHWLIEGYGYEITGLDVLSAYDYTMQAAEKLGEIDGARAALSAQLHPHIGSRDGVVKILAQKLGLS